MIESARQDGFKVGLKKSIDMEIKMVRIDAAIRALKFNLPIEDIIAVTELTEEEVLELKIKHR
jgi:hypothetical protein